MISIKLFKVVANFGNPPLCSGVIAVQNGPKAHKFTLILVMFASQPRWRNKPLKSLLEPFYLNFEQKWPKFRGDLNSRTWKATRVLPQPPWLFALVYLYQSNLFGRESLGTRLTNQCKVYLRSEDQQEQENIQKLSSSDQRSFLCKGKSCLI